jgi:hypothetical protein
MTKHIPARPATQSELIAKPTSVELKRFELTIWEKAEHWTFTTLIFATDATAALKQAKRDFPRSDYSVRDLRAAN